ncbi:MAG: hypothetical protein K2X70_10925 [Candidatus Obscuribacterales bacterium]|nr:hypothetical protein [Candidatus Obscuribacterales bacterium]
MPISSKLILTGTLIAAQNFTQYTPPDYEPPIAPSYKYMPTPAPTKSKFSPYIPNQINQNNSIDQADPNKIDTNQTNANQADPNQTPIQEDTNYPALNMMKPFDRPPMPLPPNNGSTNIADSFPTTIDPSSAIKTLSWRTQALKLAKASKIDPSLACSVNTTTTARALNDAISTVSQSTGVYLYDFSPAAGQALFLLQDFDRNITEKMWVVYKPQDPGNFDLRAQIEARNKVLNLLKAKSIIETIKSTAESKANPQNSL